VRCWCCQGSRNTKGSGGKFVVVGSLPLFTGTFGRASGIVRPTSTWTGTVSASCFETCFGTSICCDSWTWTSTSNGIGETLIWIGGETSTGSGDGYATGEFGASNEAAGGGIAGAFSGGNDFAGAIGSSAGVARCIGGGPVGETASVTSDGVTATWTGDGYGT